MQRKFIVTAVTGATLALALAGCSSNGSSLEDVQYSMNGATAEPSISFETPFAVNEATTHIIQEGSGELIKEGDNLLVDATVFKGENGEKAGSTYQQTPFVIPVGDELKKQAPELYDVLANAKVGTSFSYSTNTVPEQDASGSSSASPLPEDSPTKIEVYTVRSKLLDKAEGKELPKDQINKAIESFTIGGDKKANLKLAADRGDAPDKVVTQDLIKGSGEKVKDTDTIYVKYQGVRWEDGKAFDGNYDSQQPIDLNLQGVIKGWTEGLSGKTVGSRELLIIPANKAYGDETQQGAPTGPLVFVVDILGATDNPQAASAAQASSSAKPSASATGSASESATSSASASTTPSSSSTGQ